MDKYILDDNGNVVPCPDLMEWAKWLVRAALFETANRHVVDVEKDGVRVSTIFLGLNHNYNPQGKPILFETMVFGGDFDGEMERYYTREEAVEGHKKWVEKVFGGKHGN